MGPLAEATLAIGDGQAVMLESGWRTRVLPFGEHPEDDAAESNPCAEREGMNAVHLTTRMRVLRLEAGITMSEWAQRAGVPEPVLAQIETGHYVADLNVIAALARPLGLRMTLGLISFAGKRWEWSEEQALDASRSSAAAAGLLSYASERANRVNVTTRLHDIRAGLGMPLSEVARSAGIPEADLVAVESGATGLDLNVLAAAARPMGLRLAVGLVSNDGKRVEWQEFGDAMLIPFGYPSDWIWEWARAREASGSDGDGA